MKRRQMLAASPLLASSAYAAADPAHAPLVTTALDYIEGWYSGDAARMERALHPDLAKRVLKRLPDGRRRVEHIGALGLVQATRSRAGQQPETARREVKVLDVFRGAASLRVDAEQWIDYLQLSETEPGRWQIVNVLWEPRA